MAVPSLGQTMNVLLTKLGLCLGPNDQRRLEVYSKAAPTTACSHCAHLIQSV